MATGASTEIKQTEKSGSEYDQVYNLNINLDAPVEANGLSTGGNYSGDLVMLFEPVVTGP
ncbi:hypothetical protein [Serratia sp. ASV30]|uniref:hypothetical protein n=1 Tax=Serratia sp. ASV30 TaxID=2795127 RepID=UPI0018EDEB04|nr:hypothetical protein [Serratia sp. ASV30]